MPRIPNSQIVNDFMKTVDMEVPAEEQYFYAITLAMLEGWSIETLNTVKWKIFRIYEECRSEKLAAN